MKNAEVSYKRTQKRLLAIIMAVAFLFVVLFGRLLYIQVISSTDMQKKALDQWTRELPLQAERGSVYDANNLLIAGNYTTYSVFVRRNAVKDSNLVATTLSNILGLDYDEVYEKITKKGVSEVTISRQTEKEKVELIKLSKAAGIYFSEDNSRNYVYGDLLTQVLGFTNIDGLGQAGLEAYYDKYLKGIDGYALTETDIKGAEISDEGTHYIPAIPGYDIKLTIEYQIQEALEAAMSDAMDKYNSKGARGIVMDVNTGAIVAMSNKPSFDLNNPPRDNIALLNDLTKNNLIVDVYEPGSTFKIFTTAAALEEKQTSVNDRFYDPGYRIVDGQRIKCWRTHGHGSQTLTEGVNNSCNSVFMDLALRLGTKSFYSYLNKFGLGNVTGVDFASESRGILMPESTVKNVDLARIGFGQAVAVTPLQLITGVCAVVNGGKLYKPYLVKEISNNGQVAAIINPVMTRRVISEGTSAAMRGILQSVVDVGSGKLARVDGYAIGGKTGTAQKYENGVIAQGKYVSSFIGFAPAENPKYACLIIVDEPQGYVYYGSLVAGPYMSKMFKAIFDFKDIKPTRTEEKEKVYVTMPNLMGASLSEACGIISQLGLQYEVAGESGKVTAQTPPPGTQVEKGGIVLIKVE